MLTYKLPSEALLMRRAGVVVGEMLSACTKAATPGVSTLELDEIARGVLKKHNATSNFLGYHGFPNVICTSVNEAIIHGIPSDYVLKEGDIVGIDAGAIVEGWHADAAVTIGIGQISEKAQALITATKRALDLGIRAALVGRNVNDIGTVVDQVARTNKLGVLRDYVGHGIGEAMHEDPAVPNFPGTFFTPIKEGMCIAIEPMFTLGRPETRVLEDNWTVVSEDSSLAAHFEHTIYCTRLGPLVLTDLDPNVDARLAQLVANS